MNMIMAEGPETTTSEGDGAPVVRCSPTTRRPRRAPAQRQPIEAAPADLPVFHDIEAAFNFVLDYEGEHRGRMRGDEAVCVPCDAHWPCGPIVRMLVAAAKGGSTDGAQ